MASKFYNDAVRKVFLTLSRLPRFQQNLLHARNVLQWVEQVNQRMLQSNEGGVEKISSALKIAALGHDIECALPDRLQRSNYSSYVQYRHASHKRSAKILKDMVLNCGASEEEAEAVFNIIAHHEDGSFDINSRLLCIADALSYCDVVITFEYKRFLSSADIAKKIHWECKRMPAQALGFLVNFHYAYIPSLNRIMQMVLGELGLLDKALDTLDKAT